jgi:Bacterial Ig-like domain
MTGFHSGDGSFRSTRKLKRSSRPQRDDSRRRRPQFERLEARLVLSGQPGVQVEPAYVLLHPLGGPVAFQSASPVGLGFTPAQIRHAYGLDQITGDGTGQTIAIIDAYDAPAIKADLKAFDAYWTAHGFNLPDPPSFKKVSQTGSTTILPPAGPPGSAIETSLDVEWAHVLAPKANILLVEANSLGFADSITAAVGYAKAQPGVVAVSMSFGTFGDFAGEKAFDSVFTTPKGHTGVTFLASTGDFGAPAGYPAVSPNVVAVGGTTLTLDAMGNYAGEVGWSGSGGGISTVEAQPAFQNGVVAQSKLKRTTPDVAFDADPSSGVPIYDSTDFGAKTPWDMIGGTSLAAPCWAGIIADVDQLRVAGGGKPLDGPTQTLPRIYQNPFADYNDIVSGNNGFNALVGYDLVTGRGSPLLPSLVTDTEGSLRIIASTPANGSVVVGTPPTDFSLTFSAPYTPNSIAASDLKVNGIAANSFKLTSSTTVTFHYNSTPVTTQGLQSMTVAAGLISSASGDPRNLAFSASFRYDAVVITIDSTTPANGSITTLPFTSLTAHFNEAFDPSTISNNNLVLSQGSVSGFTIVDSQTVTYNVTGVNAVGVLQITMDPGAVTDAFGNPGGAYAGTLILVNTPVPFPTPLLPVTPDGSLIYQGRTTGTITSGSVDAYALPIAAGQTVSVLVTNSGGLEAQVNLAGSSATDVVASASSAAAGKPAAIQSLAIGATDTYLLAVSGLDGTTGDYTIQVYLNAALSSTIDGAGSNQTLGTAQNIDSSFTDLGTTAQRGAAVGTLLPGDVGPDGFGYTGIAIPSQFVDISATGKKILVGVNDGFQQLTALSGFKFSLYGATYTSVFVSSNGLITFGSGNPSFVNTDLTTAPLQAAIAPLWANLVVSGGLNSAVDWQVQGTGANQRLILQWNQCSFYAGNHTGVLTFEAILNADGSIIFNYKNLTTGDYGSNGASATVGIENTAADAGDRLLVSYQSALGGLIGNGKSIEITANPPQGMTFTETAYYAFTLFAGQTVSIAAAGQDGSSVAVGLINASRVHVASGTAPGNGSTVDSAINNFVAPAAGTYYATVTGTSGSAYSIVVTAGADFGLETNGTIDTAQNITGTNGVLSKILPSGSPSENWYSVNLTAGAEIDLQAYVLGAAAGAEFENTLTPQIELYDPSVALVGSSVVDPNTGLQSLSAIADVTGAYLVHVFGANASTGEYFLSVATIPPIINTTAFAGANVLASGLAAIGAAAVSAGSPVPSGLAAAANSTPAVNGPAAIASSSPKIATVVSPLPTQRVAASRATHAVSSVAAKLHDLIFAQFGIDGDGSALNF